MCCGGPESSCSSRYSPLHRTAVTLSPEAVRPSSRCERYLPVPVETVIHGVVTCRLRSANDTLKASFGGRSWGTPSSSTVRSIPKRGDMACGISDQDVRCCEPSVTQSVRPRRESACERRRRHALRYAACAS